MWNTVGGLDRLYDTSFGDNDITSTNSIKLARKFNINITKRILNVRKSNLLTA